MSKNIDRYRLRRQKRLLQRMDAEDNGRWVTTEEGHKIHFNEGGEPDKGNPHVIAAMTNGSKSSSDKSINKTLKQFAKLYSGYKHGYDDIFSEEDKKKHKALLKKAENQLNEVPDGTILGNKNYLVYKKDGDHFISGKINKKTNRFEPNHIGSSYKIGYCDAREVLDEWRREAHFGTFVQSFSANETKPKFNELADYLQAGVKKGGKDYFVSAYHLMYPDEFTKNPIKASDVDYDKDNDQFVVWSDNGDKDFFDTNMKFTGHKKY